MRSTAVRILLLALALPAIVASAPLIEAAAGSDGTGAACSGAPPCARGCIVDPKLYRCRAPEQDHATDGSRGVIDDAISFCDVTPPCPNGCQPNDTNRSCVIAK